MPDGKGTVSAREESAFGAARELQRLTNLYLEKVRAIYPDLTKADRQEVAVAMQELKRTVTRVRSRARF